MGYLMKVPVPVGGTACVIDSDTESTAVSMSNNPSNIFEALVIGSEIILVTDIQYQTTKMTLTSSASTTEISPMLLTTSIDPCTGNAAAAVVHSISVTTLVSDATYDCAFLP